jgi:aminoglycoside phosphotransferase (APT) family kinase protein
MDFVRGNILFSGFEITGILDFEKTALGHPIMDMARTLAFLLVDCKYKTEEKVNKYFVQSGYTKRGANKETINDDDRGLLVEMFLLYDLYKFLRHNPYESLYENEHYIRTKDILVKYGVISLR